MADLQRGFIPVQLDRERLLRFTLKETWLLVQRYGDNFFSALYAVDEHDGVATGLRLKDPDVLATYLHIGLQWDAQQHGETLTVEQVSDLVTPTRYKATFAALMMALTGTHKMAKSGNDQAGGGSVAEPAGVTPRPKVSTLPTRKGSRSRNSASRRSNSGR